MKKSSTLSPEKYQAYRKAITDKMEAAGASKKETASFSRMLDRIGRKDLLEFLFLMEKVAPLLPLDDVEVLQSIHDVRTEHAARLCPECKSRLRVDKLPNGKHTCPYCNSVW